MASKPLYIMLSSDEREKVHLAAMTASVGAAVERPVHIMVTMNALLVFEKGLSPEERYSGGPFNEDMANAKGVTDTMEQFRQARMLGEVKLYACPMVLDVKGWTLDNLEDGLFDEALGLTMFMDGAEDAQFLTL